MSVLQGGLKDVQELQPMGTVIPVDPRLRMDDPLNAELEKLIPSFHLRLRKSLAGRQVSPNEVIGIVAATTKEQTVGLAFFVVDDVQNPSPLYDVLMGVLQHAIHLNKVTSIAIPIMRTSKLAQIVNPDIRTTILHMLNAIDDSGYEGEIVLFSENAYACKIATDEIDG